MATSAVTPRPSVVRDAVQTGSVPLTVGFVLLAVAPALLALTAVVGYQDRPTRKSRACCTLSIGSAALAGLLGMIAVMLFILIGWHAASLKGLVLSEAIPHASELASHLMGILNKSAIAYLLLVPLGIIQAIAGVGAPFAEAGIR